MLVDVTSGLNTQQVKKIIEEIGREETDSSVIVAPQETSGRVPVCCHLFSVSFKEPKDFEKRFKVKEKAFLEELKKRRH
ncbi:MAG: hypothetical protein AAB740_02325 [Patescibacteria group bacterium]